MTYAKILVSTEDLPNVISSLMQRDVLVVDTETTGLRVYGNDRLFSIVVCDGRAVYYFNCNGYEEVEHRYVLSDEELRTLAPLFGAKRQTAFHNAKFDIAILEKLGIPVTGTIYDTMVGGRLLNCNAPSLSLDALAAPLGFPKDDKVKKYCDKYKLFDKVKVPGAKTSITQYKFQDVPFKMMFDYACQDAWATWKLFEHQRSQGIFETRPAENESRLIRTVLEMERHGVLVDRAYCKKALEYLAEANLAAEREFHALAGTPFKNSPKLMAELFKDEQLVYGEETATGKRNPSFKSDVLETFKSPIARVVLSIRDLKKRAEFFNTLLFYAGDNGVLHASFNQTGTATGRFSSSNPNLQNLPKPDEDNPDEAFPVRRAIVPRPGKLFHMMDYNQMEYRLMLNYCMTFAEHGDGVVALVKRIKEENLDVHQALADAAGITRRQSKTLNFAILYGAGINLISKNLKVTLEEATRLRQLVFEAVPELKTFIDVAHLRVKKVGQVRNWLGRVYDLSPDASYIAPNYICQGGCADHVKVAMNALDIALKGSGVRMVMQVHDEIVFESSDAAAGVFMPVAKKIMEMELSEMEAHLPLTCGVDHSYRSLADKVEGFSFDAT